MAHLIQAAPQARVAQVAAQAQQVAQEQEQLGKDLLVVQAEDKQTVLAAAAVLVQWALPQALQILAAQAAQAHQTLSLVAQSIMLAVAVVMAIPLAAQVALVVVVLVGIQQGLSPQHLDQLILAAAVEVAEMQLQAPAAAQVS